MTGPDSVDRLRADIENCTRCPRLVAYRSAVAPRRSYCDQTYWAKPVAGFGDPGARLWILGLAPAPTGANRTGRVFTGDRSGDFLFAALHRGGWANQPTSVSRDDPLRLTDCYIGAAARCAPPENKPLPGELTACSDYLDREWNLLTNKRVVLALGGIAWAAAVVLFKRLGKLPLDVRPDFSHGAEVALTGVTMVGSYHVSQQNTFTGRLTAAMFDTVLDRCRLLCDRPGTSGRDAT